MKVTVKVRLLQTHKWKKALVSWSQSHILMKSSPCTRQTGHRIHPKCVWKGLSVWVRCCSECWWVSHIYKMPQSQSSYVCVLGKKPTPESSVAKDRNALNKTAGAVARRSYSGCLATEASLFQSCLLFSHALRHHCNWPVLCTRTHSCSIIRPFSHLPEKSSQVLR